MIKTKQYHNGKYIQTATWIDGKLDDITCDCIHGSIHIDNFQNGGKVCRHIKNIIKGEIEKKITEYGKK